jgi:hypothetical protein
LIFKLNELIWNNINPGSKLSPIFRFISPSLEDLNLKKKYLSKVEEKLKAIGWMDTLLSPYFSYFSLVISGVYVAGGPECYRGKSLYEVLNELSPGLFLGYIFLETSSSNYLDFRKR